MSSFRPWKDAWEQALYGAGGFYRRQSPADHFRTASHASASTLAAAIGELARRHGLSRIVEVGCGGGELLTALAGTPRAVNTTLIGVELRPRPEALPDQVEWLDELPGLDATPTLLIGWELLDVVPATIAIADPDGGWHALDVDEHGRERPGATLGLDELQWCRRWAPAVVPGTRVEVGYSREHFWAKLVGRLPNGLALAVDYGTDTAGSTLTGFRDGRAVDSVPDGSCDLTAHVHWPGLVSTVSKLGGTTLTSQTEALADLGIQAVKPAASLAQTDGLGYLASLQRYSSELELVDPNGLGGFGWLLTARR